MEEQLDFGISISNMRKELLIDMNCICKIKIKEKEIGIGFLFKIPFPNKNKSFLPVLISNYYTLKGNYINNNEKYINFTINDVQKKIKIDKSRKIYKNPGKSVDIGIIEIKPIKDGIYNFIELEENEINKNNEDINIRTNIYYLDKENEITSSYGSLSGNLNCSKIKNGCPIVSYDTRKLIDIFKDNFENYNKKYGSFINYLIDEFNNKKYINEIEIVYKTDKEGEENIFGEKFVENNKNNIDLVINGNKKIILTNRYKLKEGTNKIKIIIKNKITNIEYMFCGCNSLKNITELEYLDTKDINNFSYIFSGCSSLPDIKPLQNWNVSNGKDFNHMFSGCSTLSDIIPLQNWNVSNGINFSYMFSGCSSLSDIKPLQYWDVPNGQNFDFMFSECSSPLDNNTLNHFKVSI